MKLKWYGHSCFGLTFADGTAVVTTGREAPDAPRATSVSTSIAAKKRTVRTSAERWRASSAKRRGSARIHVNCIDQTSFNPLA